MKIKSEEIKLLIVSDVRSGLNYREISERYSISIGGITKIMKKMDSTGFVQRKCRNGRKRVLEEGNYRAIYKLVRDEPE